MHTQRADRSSSTEFQLRAFEPQQFQYIIYICIYVYIYAIGAGIAAAAGTRLALQLILIKYSNSGKSKRVFGTPQTLFFKAGNLENPGKTSSKYHPGFIFGISGGMLKHFCFRIL